MNRHARRRLMLRLGFVTMLLLCAVLLDQRITAAHGYIIRMTPQDRSVLSRSPSRIQVWFSESLEPRFSTLALSNQQGEVISLVDSGAVSENRSQLSARLPDSLPDGAYVVTIRAAFASDGHVVTETMVFWIGQQTEGPLTSFAPSQAAVPLEVIWRLMTLVGLNVLFGTLLLYQVVLLPAWSNFRYRVGGLAPRVMLRLNALIWTAIIMAALGSMLALLQQTMALFEADLGTVLRTGQWSVVLRGTQVGDTLTLRLVFIAIAAAFHGGSAYIANRQPGFVSLLWAMNTAVAGLLLGTLSISSHAAGATLWPIPSIGVDWLHLLANSTWVGGLVALAITLPAALGPLADENRKTALLAALRRFSTLGIVAVALLAATGLFSSLIYVHRPAELTDTNYGRTLIAKVILLIPLLVIALYHHLVVTRGRLANLAQRLQLAERISRLVSTVGLESSLGLAVILVAALLTATPPPIPADARAGIQAPSQSVTAGDLQATLALDPGGAGTNTYEFRLTQNGQPIPGAAVKIRMVYPALDKRSDLLNLDDIGDGSYLGAGPQLDRAGTWQLQADVTLPQAQPVRMTFVWSVPDIAPNAALRQATPLNWLSVAAILGVLGVWLLPGTIRSIRATAPVLLTIGVMASLATFILLVLGAVLLDSASQQTEKLRNPIPAMINPIVADQSSIAAGQTIYKAQCMQCHGANGSGSGSVTSPVDIRGRITDRRDVDLYRVLPHQDGSGGPLDDTNRWNVINYLRSVVFSRESR